MKPECPQDWSVCPNCTEGGIEVRHCKILVRGDICPTRGLLFMGGGSFKPYSLVRKLWCVYTNWRCGIGRNGQFLP